MRPLIATLVGVAAAVAVVAPAAAAPAAGTPGTGFHARVDNAWFPLPAGSTYRYVGSREGKPVREVLRVTRQVETVDGAPCTVIRDNLYVAGHLEERTVDWYTQDAAGNVWYYGEDTAELDAKGRVVSTEGTWRAGVDGARPGIFMPAAPRVGRSYRQEFYRGHAEDFFRITGIFRPVGPPARATALRTVEWTPLEPGVLDSKFYARGVGLVVEQSVRGGSEYLTLVSVTRAS